MQLTVNIENRNIYNSLLLFLKSVGITIVGSKDEREGKSLQMTKGKQKLPKKERKFGALKGKVWMSDDFNEPLDDFKEYMPA